MPAPGTRCARRSPPSPAPAGGPCASARTCWAWTRSCPRTPRAPRPWPRPWSRSGTAASRCWPALAAWSVPLEDARVVHGAFSRDGGYEAMSAIVAAGEPWPDCVFAVTDVMAMGALARLRAGGLRVPADIALAGFDDILTLRDVYPPLTTVRLPLKRMGEMAAHLVLSEADPSRDQPRVIPVPGEVILRESTLPRPPAGPLAQLARPPAQ